MAQKRSLNKKLAGYSAVASLALATGVAYADGVLVDVDPDVVLTNGFLDINFNSADDPEYRIIDSAGLSARVGVLATGSDRGLEILVTQSIYNGTTTYTVARRLSEGAVITSGAGSWQGGNRTLGYGTFGQFPGAGLSYIGVRFQLGGSSFFYGWIEVDVAANSTQVTVSRYAFNDTQGGQMVAGLSPAAVTLQDATATAASNPLGITALITAMTAGLSGLVAWWRGRRNS